MCVMYVIGITVIGITVIVIIVIVSMCNMNRTDIAVIVSMYGMEIVTIYFMIFYLIL